MNESSRIIRAIGYAFGAAVGASSAVVLMGACAFGFEPARWSERHGRLIGVLGTINGFAGAVAGLWLALRPRRSST